MSKRKEKPEDHKNMEDAVNFCMDLVKSKPEIDGSLWVSAFLSISAFACRDSGLTFEQFLTEVCAHKCLWDKKDGPAG